MATIQLQFIDLLSGLDAWADNARFFDLFQAFGRRPSMPAPAKAQFHGNADAGVPPSVAVRLASEARQELRYLLLARHGDRFSRNALILGSMKMLRFEARRLIHCGVDEADLIQEGIFGVLRAIETFDIGRKLRFSTYAKWWVRDAMQALAQRHARTGRADMSAERPAAMAPADPAVDMPEPCDDADPGHRDTPESRLAHAQKAQLLRDAMSQLDDTGKRVLCARFGLDGADEKTLEELARELGLSAEGVRRIQGRALKQVKRCLARRQVYAESML